MTLSRKSRLGAGILILCSLMLATPTLAAEHGSTSHEDLGIGTRLEETAIVGIVFPEEENDDAWVLEVPEDGPAAKAGVKPGDTITKFNDKPIKSIKSFRELMKKQKPGDKVNLTVRRVAESLVLSVTLGKRES